MTVTATELKNRLGRYLDEALSEPVLVERSGRPSHVVLRYEDYERMARIEDAYWAAKAAEAEKSGKFLGPEKTMKRIQQMIHAKRAEEDAPGRRRTGR
ncbi:MAG: type II toxin-antitoxin system Phd/YefM family antitoxin [Acidobacteriota bacterium]